MMYQDINTIQGK